MKKYFEIDADGLIVGSMFVNQNSDGSYPAPEAGYTDTGEPDASLKIPKWNGTAWIEGIDQSGLDQEFIDYCEEKKIEVDELCASKFYDHFTNPKHSTRAKGYLELIHTIKGEVANAYWNENDKPAGDATRQPEAKIADSVDSTANYYLLLTRESSTRQISLSDMVGLVKNLSDIQLGALDDVEEVRSPKKDLINVQRDLESSPGVKANDFAAVDQIVADVQTALDALSWAAVQ